MSLFYKIRYGEKGKNTGIFFINIGQIRYIQCHEKNEAVSRSRMVPESDDTVVEIFMGDGRRTFLFTKEEYENKIIVKETDL